MFKNRSLLVKMVKDDKQPAQDSDTTPTITIEDYVHIARENGKDVVIAVGALIGSYVVLDTLRKVTIEIVKAKM
jgi:hypothetical protein